MCILLVNLITIVPVSAAVDNSKYIPKIVTEKGKNHLVFDPDLAEFARKLSSDVYYISEASTIPKNASKTLKSEGFSDIKQNFHPGSGLANFLLVDNFLVGVKSFELNGKPKHILAIAFRGSDDAGDWYVDIVGALGYEKCHIGFYTAATNAHKSLQKMKFK